MTVAGLVLAAGAGTRFGGPKVAAVVDGERLVDRAVRVLVDGGCAPVFVVLGAAVVALPAGAIAVHNDDWESGMGSSLRAGLAAAGGQEAIGAAVVVLVDQPDLSADAVGRLIAAHTAGADGRLDHGLHQRHPLECARDHRGIGVDDHGRGDRCAARRARRDRSSRGSTARARAR